MGNEVLRARNSSNKGSWRRKSVRGVRPSQAPALVVSDDVAHSAMSWQLDESQSLYKSAGRPARPMKLASVEQIEVRVEAGSGSSGFGRPESAERSVFSPSIERRLTMRCEWRITRLLVTDRRILRVLVKDRRSVGDTFIDFLVGPSDRGGPAAAVFRASRRQR